MKNIWLLLSWHSCCCPPQRPPMNPATYRITFTATGVTKPIPTLIFPQTLTFHGSSAGS
ncbi:MAG: hypothetical protein HS114_01715 [Anaerolineales bacterium]|nr:hypothetical protein [Anaerolineales bacterium]